MKGNKSSQFVKSFIVVIFCLAFMSEPTFAAKKASTVWVAPVRPKSAEQTTTFFYMADAGYTGTQNGQPATPWTCLGLAATPGSAWNTINQQLSISGGNTDVTVYFTARQPTSDADAPYGTTGCGGGGTGAGTTAIDVTQRTDASTHRLTLDGVSYYNTSDSSPSWQAYGSRCQPAQNLPTGYSQIQLTKSCSLVMSITEINATGSHYSNNTFTGFHVMPINTNKGVALCGDNQQLINSNIEGPLPAGGVQTWKAGPAVILQPTSDGARQGSDNNCPPMGNVLIDTDVISRTFGEGIYLGGGLCGNGMVTSPSGQTSPTIPGTGYAVSPIVNFTDLATPGAGSTTVTSASGSFPSWIQGQALFLPGGGTNFVPGWYYVSHYISPNQISVSGTANTVACPTCADGINQYGNSGVSPTPGGAGSSGVGQTVETSILQYVTTSGGVTTTTPSTAMVKIDAVDGNGGIITLEVYNQGAPLNIPVPPGTRTYNIAGGDGTATLFVVQGINDATGNILQCTNFNTTALSGVQAQVFPAHHDIQISNIEEFNLGGVNYSLCIYRPTSPFGGPSNAGMPYTNCDGSFGVTGGTSGQGDGIDFKGGLYNVTVFNFYSHDSLDWDGSGSSCIIMQGRRNGQYFVDPLQNIDIRDVQCARNYRQSSDFFFSNTAGSPGGIAFYNAISSNVSHNQGISSSGGCTPCLFANSVFYQEAGQAYNTEATFTLENLALLDNNLTTKSTQGLGGTGYVQQYDVPVSCTGSSGTGMTIDIKVSSGGVISSWVPRNPGNGYKTTDTNCTLQGGSGTGAAAFNLTTIGRNGQSSGPANNIIYNGSYFGTCNPGCLGTLADTDFVSPSTLNFNPSSSSSKVHNAGKNLTSLTNTPSIWNSVDIAGLANDFNGNPRSISGSWDAGALNFISGGGGIATVTTCSISPGTSTYGATQTAIAHVTAGGVSVSNVGIVTFTLGGVSVGTANVDSSGNATLAKVLNAGSWSGILASYNDSTATYASSNGTSSSFIVNKVSLTLTADNKTIQFGGVLVYTGVFSGFVNGDTALVITGTPTFSTNATMTGMNPNVGVWSIIPAAGTATATNYNINTFVNGVLTVTPAPTTSTTTTVTGPGATTYGATQNFMATVLDSSSIPVTGGTVTFTDTTSGSVVIAANATINGSGQASGSGILQSGTRTVTATYNPSSTYSGSTGTTTATVNKSSLTATADNKTVQFGTKPIYSGTLTGFVNGDNSSSVSGSLTFSTDATMTGDHPNVGTWAIIPAVGTVTAANYTVGTFVNGILTVTPAAPISTTTTATNSGTVTYGANQTFTATVLDNTLNPVTTGTVTFTDTTFGSITIANNVALNGSGQASTMGILQSGSRTVTATYNPSSAYLASAGNTTAIVNKATLTLTANNVTIRFGQLPTYTGVYSGFVNGDTSAVVSGTPAYSNNATMSGRFPNVGTWTITPAIGSATSPNYNISTFVTGVLIVTPAPLNNIQGQLKP